MISSTGSVASIFETAMAASLWLYPSEPSNGLPGPLRGGRCGRGSGHVFQADAVHKALGHLVFQFQHNALGQLGPHTGGRLERLVVACRDGQRHPVRLHHAQDGKAHLGAHARNGGQHLKAGLLLLGGKAVEADIVLRHAHHGVQSRFFYHAGQRPGHAGRALGVVAHPAAADHHRVHGLFDDFSG